MSETKHTVPDVRQLRQEINQIIVDLDADFSPSRELSLVKTKLEEAKMWAGKELGNLGQKLPKEYADDADGKA